MHTLVVGTQSEHASSYANMSLNYACVELWGQVKGKCKGNLENIFSWWSFWRHWISKIERAMWHILIRGSLHGSSSLIRVVNSFAVLLSSFLFYLFISKRAWGICWLLTTYMPWLPGTPLATQEKKKGKEEHRRRKRKGGSLPGFTLSHGEVANGCRRLRGGVMIAREYWIKEGFGLSAMMKIIYLIFSLWFEKWKNFSLL